MVDGSGLTQLTDSPYIELPSAWLPTNDIVYGWRSRE